MDWKTIATLLLGASSGLLLGFLWLTPKKTAASRKMIETQLGKAITTFFLPDGHYRVLVKTEVFRCRYSVVQETRTEDVYLISYSSNSQAEPQRESFEITTVRPGQKTMSYPDEE